MKKFGNLVITVSMLFILIIFAVIAGMTNYIIRDAKKSLLDNMSARTDSLARSSREAFLPKLDRFWLHFLVNEFARDKMTRYVLISDAKGRVLSHSLPERIGGTDPTQEGRAARSSGTPLLQTFKGADGLEYYYFSAPIMLGNKRLGTAAAALNTVTIDTALADTREKLLIILLSALVALLLMAEIRILIRREQRTAKLKSDMVHTVSHEFNNALMAIDACVFLLEESDTEPDKDGSRARIYQTLANARRSLRLYVKNILNEARMESGKFKIEKKPLALIDLTEETITAMAELIRQKNISIVMDLPKNCRLLVDADHEAMALVIANLIGNAVKYTPKGGRVEVKITAKSGALNSLVFRVDDTGPGISGDDIERIKAGFYRTEEGRAVASGFGLGLKISNNMLQLHGSVLEVESKNGKGSSFYFSLPILETDCKLPVK